MSFVDDEAVLLLQQLEEELWQAATRFDRAQMEKLFASDFTEIGRSGRCYSRSDMIAVEGDSIDCVLPLPGFQVRALSPDVVLVTYNSKVVYNGEVEHARSRRGSSWELRFHQGTPYAA